MDDDLAAPAAALSAALHRELPVYLLRRCREALQTMEGDVDDELTAMIERETPAVLEVVDRVLHADVDSGAGSPLDAIRRRVGPYNAFLAERAAPTPHRGEFEQRHFPDDVYALGPANFREISDELHEPGIVWGAVRAHVHLRRRAEAEESAP